MGRIGRPQQQLSVDYDVVVIGAGFAGLNALHNFRARGLRTVVLEAGGGVGGTWYWNRYPGARVDIESMEYSYGFSEELQQEWHWPELYSAQPDVLRYLEWVADRLGLRKDVRLNHRVRRAEFDESSGTWLIGYTRGDTATGQAGALRARFCVMATGFLSAPVLPDIPGLTEFPQVVHTGAWPAEGIALSGQRVGVIGTAASGVQVVQTLAQTVGELVVFQRTANWCFPLRNKAMPPEYERYVKQNYPEIRRLEMDTRGSGAVLIDRQIVVAETRRALDLSPAERERDWEWRWRSGGVHMGRSFVDLVTDEKANNLLRQFLVEKIRRQVKDPAIAEKLIPDHPPLTRRPPGESGYYEAFNQPNVRLVDVRSDPIHKVTPHGVVLDSGARHELDVLICATGFDSGSGAVLRIEVRGSGGRTLREHWMSGVRTHLGMMVHGFPNLFLLNGPQSPSAHFSPPVLAHYQSDLACRLLTVMTERAADWIEPTADAETQWCEHVNTVYAGTLIPRTNSWWMGANIPGKPRQALAYGGGFAQYRHRAESGFGDHLADYELGRSGEPGGSGARGADPQRRGQGGRGTDSIAPVGASTNDASAR